MMAHLPFLWAALFFMMGIFIHSAGYGSVNHIAVISVGVVFGAYVYRRKKWVFVVLLAGAFVLLGWLCTYSRWLFAADHIYFQKQAVSFARITLRGVVDGSVRRGETGYTRRLSFVLNLREVKDTDGWRKVSGKVLVNLFQDLDLDYGDDLVLTGKLHRPFEFSRGKKFSYRSYLKRQGIHYVLSVKKNSFVEVLRSHQGNWLLSQLYQWRSVVSRIPAEHLNVAHSSLVQAMLLGERLHIPASLNDVFAKTGTTHILAISGFNVGIVVAVLFLLFRMLPLAPMVTYGLTIGFVIFYVVLTGASPSVVRAGIMAVVFLTSFVIERETYSINTLAFAAFLILWLDPQNIFDVGFQLSFISVLAILLFYPCFIECGKPLLKKYSNKVLKFILESFAVSLSATLGVAGLIAYYFEIMTPVSLVSNLIVVPLSMVVTILGIGMLVCVGTISQFATCIQFALNIMVWFMMMCQQLPGAYHYFQSVNVWHVVSYYCFVIALWLWLEPLSRIDKDRQV
jgi:competence protein ComEC